jgi:hypothetical protein
MFLRRSRAARGLPFPSSNAHKKTWDFLLPSLTEITKGSITNLTQHARGLLEAG